jgi:hypothetical protein
MTPSIWVWTFLMWLSLPLLVLLASVMVWRRLHREFPFFFAYVVVASLVGIVRFIVHKNFPGLYLHVYWWSDFIGVLAALLAIYETFLRRIFPGFAAVRFYRYLFPAAGVIIAFLAFLTVQHSADTRAAYLATSRVLDFVRSAVIGFFVLVILLMGRQFTGYEFSIAAGFGIQAAVMLANTALRLQTHAARSTVLDRIDSLVFDVCCLIWLWVFSRENKPAPPPGMDTLDPETLHQAKKWEEMLKDLLTPGKRLL